jgi:hypothetical protein
MRAEPYEFRAMEAILGRISEDYEHRFAIMAPVIHKVHHNGMHNIYFFSFSGEEREREKIVVLRLE